MCSLLASHLERRRYTVSRAVKAFQGGKVYKPSKALRLLKKHNSKSAPTALADDALAEGEELEPLEEGLRNTSEINFEFETTGTSLE